MFVYWPIFYIAAEYIDNIFGNSSSKGVKLSNKFNIYAGLGLNPLSLIYIWTVGFCNVIIIINPPGRRRAKQLLLVSSVVWMCFFVYGLCMGAPTVFIPQIRREANSTEAVSDAMASWLSAILFYGSIPWVVIIPIVAGTFGRKIPLFIVCLNTFAAFIVFYTSNNVIQIMISEVMESVTGAAIMTLAIMMITEYTSPKYRGFFLTFKSATIFWGIWLSNAIGTFFHWKYIAVVQIVCSIYSLIMVFFIPESPYWLASKGKFKQCIESHRWLKGTDENSEMELERLVNSQKEYLTDNSSETLSMSRVRTIFVKKEFYKPTLLAMLVMCLYSFTGKIACSFYSLDIIKKITASEATAYVGMLILDGVTVIGMYIGSGLSRCLKRRTLLLASTVVGVIFLFILSLYVYSTKMSYIVENQYVSIILLICYSLSICSGPLVMASCVFAEMLPLRHRSLSVCIIIIFDDFWLGSIVKLSPYVIQRFGLEFAFFFFGVSSTICIVLLYKYLPETKDKTLQEIADIMAGEALISEERSELTINKVSKDITLPIITSKSEY